MLEHKILKFRPILLPYPNRRNINLAPASQRGLEEAQYRLQVSQSRDDTSAECRGFDDIKLQKSWKSC